MIPLRLSEVVAATGGQLLHGSPELCFTGCTTDSRKVKPGELYIPMIGEHLDGNDFIGDALDRGAAGCLISDLSKIPLHRDLEAVGLVYTGDTVAALQQLASFVLKKKGIPVVAVTGSTGKTSTKEMLASVLGTQYSVLRTEGNYNNHIGLPLTCLRLEAHHEIAVLEMGMNHAGEIAVLAEIARPVCGVITNIGLSHIENLGSQEAILSAKLEIASHMTAEHTLIVSGDDPRLASLSGLPCRAVTVGLGQENLCRLSDSQLDGLKGSRFTLAWPERLEKPLECHLTVPGLHNIRNAGLAAAVGLHFGITPENVARGLRECRNTGMRLNLIETGRGVTLINDAYNASPDSMEAALGVLAMAPEGRRAAVVSDMLELGAESEAGHRRVGEAAARCGVDGLFGTGPLSRWTVEAADAAGLGPEKARHFETKEALIQALLSWARPGDTLLVKGSRGMRMEQVVEALQEGFSHE